MCRLIPDSHWWRSEPRQGIMLPSWPQCLLRGPGSSTPQRLSRDGAGSTFGPGPVKCVGWRPWQCWVCSAAVISLDMCNLKAVSLVSGLCRTQLCLSHTLVWSLIVTTQYGCTLDLWLTRTGKTRNQYIIGSGLFRKLIVGKIAEQRTQDLALVWWASYHR